MNDYNVYRDGSIEKQIGARVPIKRWTVGVPVEKHAEAQLHNVANLPFIDPHGVVVLPDCHVGIGCTIGAVIPTIGAIIPSAAGVDLGCGVDLEFTTLKKDMLPKDLASVREILEKTIPKGSEPKGNTGSWEDPPVEVKIAWEELEPGYKELTQKYPRMKHKNPIGQLGTLGSSRSNHFIEIVVDEDNQVGISLHSGSRGPGNKMGQFFINAAKNEMKRWFIDLYDMGLAYLPEGTELFKDYLKTVTWAQRYAQINRELMRDLCFKALKNSKLVPKFERDVQVISCHHNYVARENHFKRNIWVTRKGAICARKGLLGIIPGSMGAKTYIVRGLGNKESYCSASHGAGRLMSRTEAKNTFSIREHIEATKGIECKKDSSVIDETPAAYKSIDDVMNAQKDLVEIVNLVRQLVCIKG